MRTKSAIKNLLLFFIYSLSISYTDIFAVPKNSRDNIDALFHSIFLYGSPDDGSGSRIAVPLTLLLLFGLYLFSLILISKNTFHAGSKYLYFVVPRNIRRKVYYDHIVCTNFVNLILQALSFICGTIAAYSLYFTKDGTGYCILVSGSGILFFCLMVTECVVFMAGLSILNLVLSLKYGSLTSLLILSFIILSTLMADTKSQFFALLTIGKQSENIIGLFISAGWFLSLFIVGRFIVQKIDID